MEKIFVAKPTLPDFDDYTSEIKDIWETKQLSNFGPKYEKFKNLLKENFDYKNIDIQVNGHLLLENMLNCIEKGEVITTPFTFISTTLAIKNAGHDVVFCDINETDYNINVDEIEKLITSKTVAIVPVHVFGNPCDVEKLDEIAEKYNVKIIYDAAHALACQYKNVDIGNFGDASMFSFHATKVFNTIEGGMGVFKDENFCEKVKQMSNFGLNSNAVSEFRGINSKYNEFQASMGIANLKNLKTSIEKRKIITEKYDVAFKDIDGLKIQIRNKDVVYNYAYYPVVIKDNFRTNIDNLIRELNEKNIYPRRYFYPAINDMPQFSNDKETPVARKVSQNIICLPIYDSLEEENINRIIAAVKGE
ncbi:dTDP-4-amino-4,6-dideoxygalactose transaminase [Bacilli bacterium PM5-3]|nr:dTDP-4-amino-4,6-dideoxygalactose transaminase [Bacilli bacterium PM5-3]